MVPGGGEGTGVAGILADINREIAGIIIDTTMNYNNHHIEKRSFEAFVNAIGTEIEQAQVRLISAANAQMLFHYWKMGNYIL